MLASMPHYISAYEAQTGNSTRVFNKAPSVGLTQLLV